MRYLDTNVFVYAALDATPTGENARTILREMTTGQTPAITAALMLDEFLWVMQRQADRATALRQASRIVAFPHLTILDVKTRHIVAAMDLMEQHPALRPRDAIHAAVTLHAGVYDIVSDDDDFDALRTLHRTPL